MYMDAEPAVIFGREVLGEPKKQATSRLFRRGSAMHGLVERDGVRLMAHVNAPIALLAL
jgi:acetoacetate decarboxylase